MKASLVVVFALPLLMCVAASAQDRSAAASPKLALVSAPAKLLTVLGKVSDDGKTLLTDIDSEWTVSNPDALKGYEGYRVRSKCYVDSESGRIRVVSVRKEGDLKYAAQSSDSAFRR